LSFKALPVSEYLIYYYTFNGREYEKIFMGIHSNFLLLISQLKSVLHSIFTTGCVEMLLFQKEDYKLLTMNRKVQGNPSQISKSSLNSNHSIIHSALR